ncbi:hypothetical protein DTO013E5_6186 [Penicillium roqueforti]|uniref:uncharacterized protein n=1 Tax=Penicillium roqueforti TaxID=5082 RepID=UPI00190C5EB7|nr:uncharacterized protein LCP9604111_6575 [Penicillium roqueforti]KAF9246815.1 hypothetical protein LCP9604111_6575 [Penicillium roqueforti]KAI1829338.1 hypothetical protein CBS147337_9851 [Penicillium roqueforti]KAI2669642.1 hypothetical protein CBS147355_9769 [Penicillium roqueforti]KAI2680171.1 hypothetical protein LCP963914a_7261 [Penicillium roqueforti]KAI2695809.1 hypothetical protein CBS147372_8918 [Penicillium roqueforti]
MSSQTFLPIFSPPSSPSPVLRPRRPSLEPEREILSTRGQHILNLFPSRTSSLALNDLDDDTPERRLILRRGSLLIGHSNPRYEWKRYYKSPESLKNLPKEIRKYHERNNGLISQYLYIDRLLDSSLPHNLIEDYNGCNHHSSGNRILQPSALEDNQTEAPEPNPKIGRVKRTPHNLYRIPDETTPLVHSSDAEDSPLEPFPDLESHGGMSLDDEERVINLAIRLNFVANVALLASKIAIMAMTNSMSMLAGLVDGVLDFLSTVIVWVTTIMIRRQDRNRYPISRRRLEPVSVLIFSVIMVTSFFQVALSSIKQLIGDDRTVVKLSIPSISLMGGTVLVKLLCWIWCRLIPSPSVQVLAQDAMTDVVFNTFSIIFPLVGTAANLWYLDPLGGLFLSFYIMWNWGQTAAEYIQRLTGAAASPDDHSVLLYMTMRFSRVIHKIQDLKAYYASDKLNVEVDLVVDEKISLRDSHDVGESLQYIIESVPTVDRAFVHLDYDEWNLPSHMNQMDR